MTGKHATDGVSCQVYTPKEILHKATVYRERESSRVNVPATAALFFSFGRLSFALLYRPKYFYGSDHLEFFATSHGFESYTETGYKSLFIPSRENGIYSLQKIRDYVLGVLKKETGIDLLAKERVPIQLSLF